MENSDGMEDTYSSKCNNLTRELSSNILRDTVEVENELRESLAVMPLPLTNVIQGICRRLLTLGCFYKGLPFPISRGNKFLLECTGVRVVRPASEKS